MFKLRSKETTHCHSGSGSFAVGGSVVTAPGKFDPIKHGAFNPANQSSEGQTLHGDHAYVFIRFQTRQGSFRW